MIRRLSDLAARPLQHRTRAAAVALTVVATGGALMLVTRADPTQPPRARPAPRPAAAVDPIPMAQPSPAPASQTARDRIPRAEFQRIRRAGRRFLAGYLPYTYGHDRRLVALSAELREELTSRPPRVPARERRRHPRLQLLQDESLAGDRAELLALVTDGRRRYGIHLTLERSAAGWVVVSVEG